MGQDKVEPKQWEEIEKLKGMEFDYKVRRHRECTDKIKELEAEKKIIAIDIEAALLAVGETKLAVYDLTAKQCNGTTATTVSRTALVVAGVDPDIIKACTIAGTKYTYVQVTRKGEKD